MNVFDLAAKITLDKSEYESGLKDAEKIGSTVGSKIGGAFKTAAKIGAAAIGTATTAVSAFAASAVNTGMTFDSSMSQVAATLGKTVDEIKDLRDFAQDMGAKTAFSATQAADALNYMALAGYDASASMDMLPNVLNLAAAGGIELARASDMVTDAASALGFTLENGAPDIERTSALIDEMAKTSSKSNTSVAQLGDAILTIGGTAKILSGGTNELNTALGILADNGIKGAEGGTKLRNILLSLSAPTDKAAEKLEALGVTAIDTATGDLRPLDDIMLDLNKSLEGLGEAEKAEVISSIFNKQDIAGVNALLNTSSERWDELSGAIADSKGAAEAMAETQLDNLAGDVTLLKSAFEGAQIAISDALTGGSKSEGLRAFVNFGTEGIQKLTDAFKSGGFESAMEVFGDVLSDGIAMVMEKLPEVVNAGTKLLSALGKGLLDNIDVILFAVGDIAMSLIQGLLEATEGQDSMLMEILNTIAGVFEENYMTIMDMGFQILNNIIQGIINGLPELISHAEEIILEFGNALIENLPLLITSMFELIQTLALGIAQALPDLIPTIVDIVLTIVDSLISNIDLLIDAAIALMMGLTEGLIAALPVLLGKAPEIIQKLVNAIITNVPKLLVASAEMITKLVVGIVQNLPKLLESGMKIVTSIKTGIARMFVKLVATGKDIIEKVKDGIKSIDPVKWGQDMIDSFVSGIKDRISKVIETAKDIAGTIKDYLGFSEPKKGPLSNFHTFAPDMMQLFADGITANKGLITDAINDSFNLQREISTSMGVNASRNVLQLNGENVQPINVNITLEGDAERLFRIVSIQAKRNQEMTGSYAF